MTRGSKQTEPKPDNADKRIQSETESDRLLATDRVWPAAKEAITTPRTTHWTRKTLPAFIRGLLGLLCTGSAQGCRLWSSKERSGTHPSQR